MAWRTTNSFTVEKGGEVTLTMSESDDFSEREYELKVEPYGEHTGGSVTLNDVEMDRLETLVGAMRSRRDR